MNKFVFRCNECEKEFHVITGGDFVVVVVEDKNDIDNKKTLLLDLSQLDVHRFQKFHSSFRIVKIEREISELIIRDFDDQHLHLTYRDKKYSTSKHD